MLSQAHVEFYRFFSAVCSNSVDLDIALAIPMNLLVHLPPEQQQKTARRDNFLPDIERSAPRPPRRAE